MKSFVNLSYAGTAGGASIAERYPDLRFITRNFAVSQAMMQRKI
jgi:hypothetical protein